MAKARKTDSEPALNWEAAIWQSADELRKKEEERWVYGVPLAENAIFACVWAR